MSEEKKKCPGCAEMIPADASMCEYCGEKFNTSAQMEPAAENPELYAPQTAAKWSLLFTPVFGAYVLKNNWKALGQAPQEKRSKNLMIALVVIYAAGLLFLNEVPCIILHLVALAGWYFAECRAQIKYLAENKLDCQQTKWKPLIQKAACVWAAALVLCFIILALCGGGPQVDCSSNQAFKESGKEIVDYLSEDLGAKELSEKAQYGDLSEDEEALLTKFAKIVQFFNIYAPQNIPDAVVKKIDGMSASDLLDYVDEHYSLSNGGWLTRTKE